MRKYLLASAAVLGLLAGNAQAANFAQTDPSTGAGSAGAPKNNPDPGKIIVRVSGLVAVGIGIIGTSSDKSQLAAGPGAGAKNDKYGMEGYFRLYFGVDGKLTNGIIYGANSEMRTNFAGGQATGYTGTGAIGNASANSNASLWFTRRAYAYIGGDAWGIVRVGQGDGPLSLFNSAISTGEAYSTGQWDGDVCDYVGAGCVGWGFYDIGNEYDSNKIVWVSPKIAGFNFGVSFAPSSSALSANGSNTAAGGLSNRSSTSGVTSDLGRPRNIFEVAARWQGNLGPVAIDTDIGYIGSSFVSATAAAPLPGGVTGWRDLSVVDGGLVVTMAGFSVFGHANTGTSNGTATPAPKLASGRKMDSTTWTVGAQWTGGPFTVGTSWYSFQTMGSAAGTGNRSEQGFSVGGNYNPVPGLNFYLEYLYGARHQLGVNFRDAGGPATQGNTLTTNAILATTVVTW